MRSARRYPEVLMASNEDLQPDRPQTLIDRAVRSLAGPDRDPNVALRRDPEYIVPADERKVAMRGLDELEVKISVCGILLSALVAIGVAVYVSSVHETTKNGKATVTVSPDAFLVGGLVLLFCIFGLVALRLRKRTVVAFAFMLNGLALTLVLLPLGLALVLLGGWLMLRAFRINKYGTANSKAVARQASARRAGTERQLGRPRSGATIEDLREGDTRVEDTDGEQALHAEGAATTEIPKSTE